MPHPYWIVEPESLDTDHVIADLSEIRQYNPQRCNGAIDGSSLRGCQPSHLRRLQGSHNRRILDSWPHAASAGDANDVAVRCGYAGGELLRAKHQLYTSVGCLLRLTGTCGAAALHALASTGRHDTSIENSRHFADLPVPMHIRKATHLRWSSHRRCSSVGQGPTTTQCTSRPAFIMTYNPPNYAELLENYGFSWVLESNSFSRGTLEKGSTEIRRPIDSMTEKARKEREYELTG